MERDSFVTYRSFYESVKDFDKETIADIYIAINEFALNHNEVELNGVAKAIFTLIKPQLEASYLKAMSGSKGGKTKPTKLGDKVKQIESKTQANDKQSSSKTEAKRKQSASNANANANVNVDIKEIIKEKYSEKKAKAVLDYLAMRKAIKKPLTNLDYLDKELNKLSSNEEEQIAILDQSTFSSYQGLFPLKNSNKIVSTPKDIQVVYDDSNNVPVTDEEIENFRKYRQGIKNG